MSLATHWRALAAQKRDWAFAAYAEFIATLSAEVGERLGQKEQQAEPYVVVFGKTQVGKTTLLLDLMGVLPEQLARVSAVLRGGRRQGQSATATAMEYRRSPDRRWGLRVDAALAWHADDAAMQQALGALRTAMEAQQLQVRDPCVAYLPCDCFDAAASGPAVRMLDLPGDKPANAAEQLHVHEMARRYVPLADLILLVGRGDDLSFLQTGGLALPVIEDWQSAPRRFRIVTTFSFASQTVRDMVREETGAAAAGRYRRRLIEQIRRTVALSDDVCDEARYFPLEFGQSWLDARTQQQDFYARLAPMLAGLRQQLLDDIHAATTPLARLRSAVEAHLVIARVKEQRLQAMQARAAQLDTELQRALREQQQARQACMRVGKAADMRAQQLAVLSAQQLQEDLAQLADLRCAQPRPGESVSAFRNAIQRACSALRQAVHEAAASGPGGAHQRFWRTVRPQVDTTQVQQVLDDAFRALRRVLSAYLIDRYVFTGEKSDYRRDWRNFDASVDSACGQLSQLLRTHWLESALAQLREEHASLAQQRRQQQDWQALADQASVAVEALTQERAAHEVQRLAFEQQMDRDLAESRRFRDLLDRHFLRELQTRSTAIRSDKQAVTAFLSLLAAHQLSHERKQVLRTLDTNLSHP